MANIIQVQLDTGGTTVQVALRGGLVASASNVTIIDGFWVTKGAGNVASTIEVNDRIMGWLDADTFIAGEVNALPYTTPGNIDSAIQGDIA